jgi:hypothetical protein
VGVDVSEQQARELQAVFNSPEALLLAINDRLGQVQVIVARLTELGWKISAPIPDAVFRDGAAADSGPVYLSNGMTAPRADGAVRVRGWDEAITAALASTDVNVQRWGREKAAAPWIFLQDVLKLGGITSAQKVNIGSNCANARMFNGFLGGNPKGFSAPAYEFSTKSGSLVQGDLVADAFAVNDDRVMLDGQVITRGWWAADMTALATRSLAHFLATSGKATRSLAAATFMSAGKR